MRGARALKRDGLVLSAGVRVSAIEASIVAAELVAALRGGCERIEVAGSLRRGRPDVGDIELVAIPTITRETVPDGMFDERIVERDGLAEAVEALRADGVLIPHPDRPAMGQRYSRLLHVGSGLQVDLFAVLPPAQWGVIFLIRTGPADYSQRVVTLARKRGYHVSAGAVHRGGLGCGSSPCEVIATPDEYDVLRLFGLPPLMPEQRT